MHHLLEIFIWLLVVFIIGWLLGKLLFCAAARRRAQAVKAPEAPAQPQALAATSAAAGAGVAAATAAAGKDRAYTAAAAEKTAEEEARKSEQATAEAEADAEAEATAEAEAEVEADQGGEAGQPAMAASSGELKAYGLSAPVGEPDDLQMISGIGPKLEKMLHEQGIYHFAQIAAWTEKDIAEIDDKLKFKGRIEREEWVRQAKLLAAGKLEQFEEEYGTGGKAGADGKTRAGSRTRRGSSQGDADRSDVAEASEGADATTQELPAHGLSAPVGEPDDLQLISGVGPKLEKMLHDMGIYHYAQIAAWTDKDIAEIDGKLKFRGRIERDEWVRQAKLLAAGKLEQFAEEYGTGGKAGADGKTHAGSRTRRKK